MNSLQIYARLRFTSVRLTRHATIQTAPTPVTVRWASLAMERTVLVSDVICPLPPPPLPYPPISTIETTRTPVTVRLSSLVMERTVMVSNAMCPPPPPHPPISTRPVPIALEKSSKSAQNMGKKVLK